MQDQIDYLAIAPDHQPTARQWLFTAQRPGVQGAQDSFLRLDPGHRWWSDS